MDVSTQPGQNGSLTVVGPGAFTQDLQDDSYVDVGGPSSVGQLTINGATLHQSGLDMSVNVAPGSTLTVENGGALNQDEVSGDININGNLILNNGTVSGGSFGVSIASATVTNGSLVTSQGSINFNGSVVVDDSTITSFGSVGNMDGTLTIQNGGYVEGDSIWDVTGTINVSSGRLLTISPTFQGDINLQLSSQTDGPIFGGAVTYGGALGITLEDGFTPTLGERFLLFSFSSYAGAFNHVDLPPLPGGEAWNISQLYTTGTISVVPEPTSIGLTLAAGALLLRRRP